MHRLSIIIPVSGSVDRLEATLVSVLENRPEDCEILVLLAAPYDDPYDLAGEVRFIDIGPGTSAVEMLNGGVEQSQGRFVHFLAAGCEVDEGWADSALNHFDNPRVASVGPVVLDAADRKSIVATGVGYSSWSGRVVVTDEPQELLGDGVVFSPAVDVVGPTLVASFYRRSTFELVRGFEEGVGAFQADVDLAMILRFAGYESVVEARSRVFAASDMFPQERAGFRSGRDAAALFCRAVPTVSSFGSLVTHTLGVATRFFKCLPRSTAFTTLLGQAYGLAQACRYYGHRRWLREIREMARSLHEDETKEHWRIDGPHAIARRYEHETVSRRMSA